MNNKNDFDSKENLGHGIKGGTDAAAKLKNDKKDTQNSMKNEMSNMDELL